MEKIIVSGGNQLKGSVDIDGAKNAALPILAATILASKGKNVIDNIPLLSDIHIMNEVLKHLNVDVSLDEENQTIETNAEKN